MVVVDSVRFPYMDGTGLLTTGVRPAGWHRPVVPTADRQPTSRYSVQRYQPYRGGHAVPVAPPTGHRVHRPARPRPGRPALRLHRADRGSRAPDSLSVEHARHLLHRPPRHTSYYATQTIYHTLGWANEYEQGSLNRLAEPWDYFPFNDRDFTSVAELMLVPGCSPGLFTKQFVEFAAGAGQCREYLQRGDSERRLRRRHGPGATIVERPSTHADADRHGARQTATDQHRPVTETRMQAVQHGLDAVWLCRTPRQRRGTLGVDSAAAHLPVLERRVLLLGLWRADHGVDDAGGQVGGYAGDGWFKMFEFFEVPSQSIGAIGPVASGSNFDWYRAGHQAGPAQSELDHG